MHELMENDIDCMKDLLGVIRDKKEKYIKSSRSLPIVTDKINQLSRFERFLGPLPAQVDVLPPPQTKNKGRPRQKRLKGVVEKFFAQKSKESRRCTKCNLTGHNSRTCKKDESA